MSAMCAKAGKTQPESVEAFMATYVHFVPDKDGIVGKGVKFERIRRITGYLVGTLDRFNNAKRAEEKDRVKHGAIHECA